jgi:hypothetical protein
LIDSKGRDFGCFVQAKAGMPAGKEKAEQAPALHTQ